MTTWADRIGLALWRAAEVAGRGIYAAAQAVERFRQLRRIWMVAVMSEVARRRAARREFRLTTD